MGGVAVTGFQPCVLRICAGFDPRAAPTAWSWGAVGRATGSAPPVVRIRRHEVRDPQTPQGQASPRLRSDEGAGGPDARLLLTVAGHGVSDAAVARGRRARRR